jgi:hypothetical protein
MERAVTFAQFVTYLYRVTVVTRDHRLMLRKVQENKA